MSKKLEDFIIANKKKFDDKKPKDKVWDEIEKHLDQINATNSKNAKDIDNELQNSADRSER